MTCTVCNDTLNHMNTITMKQVKLKCVVQSPSHTFIDKAKKNHRTFIT